MYAKAISVDLMAEILLSVNVIWMLVLWGCRLVGSMLAISSRSCVSSLTILVGR
jgi:hypothetical protein